MFYKTKLCDIVNWCHIFTGDTMGNVKYMGNVGFAKLLGKCAARQTANYYHLHCTAQGQGLLCQSLYHLRSFIGPTCVPTSFCVGVVASWFIRSALNGPCLASLTYWLYLPKMGNPQSAPFSFQFHCINMPCLQRRTSSWGNEARYVLLSSVELSFRLKNARVRVFKGLGFAYVHLPGCRTQK